MDDFFSTMEFLPSGRRVASRWTTRGAEGTAMAAPPLLYELVEEILLRLPPDDPPCLVRASTVCKLWRRVVGDPRFLRRYREFHGTPPMLGFFHNMETYNALFTIARFVPASTCSFLLSPFIPGVGRWYMLDSRHGRVLFFIEGVIGLAELAVWDPITGELHRLRVPRDFLSCRPWNATLLCAAAGCNHLNCHSCAFLVAMVTTNRVAGVTSASFYSWATSAWSTVTSIQHPTACVAMHRPSVVVGDTAYFICKSSSVLKYDMAAQQLAIIPAPFTFELPFTFKIPFRHNFCAVLTVTAGGMLGIAGVHGSTIKLWSMEAGAAGVGRWTEHHTIELKAMFPTMVIRSPCYPAAPALIGFADQSRGSGVIFVRIDDLGVFTIELESGQIKKVSNSEGVRDALPYITFYTPDILRRGGQGSFQ